jgi:hypothetical protein
MADSTNDGRLFKHLQVIIPTIAILGALVAWCLGLSSRITALEVQQRTELETLIRQEKRLVSLTQTVADLPAVIASTKKNTEDIRELSGKIENIRGLLIELKTILTLKGY